MHDFRVGPRRWSLHPCTRSKLYYLHENTLDSYLVCCTIDVSYTKNEGYMPFDHQLRENAKSRRYANVSTHQVSSIKSPLQSCSGQAPFLPGNSEYVPLNVESHINVGGWHKRKQRRIFDYVLQKHDTQEKSTIEIVRVREHAVRSGVESRRANTLPMCSCK
jgi:hypothetical protein